MKITRRRFIESTAAATAAASLPIATRAYAGGAVDDIRVAVIGIRGQGGGHMRGYGKNLAAVCDVDETVIAARTKGLKGIKTFTDYRKLLDEKDIHAVSIATPNHLHAMIAIHAAQAGKDVYVEKPVSHHVWEGRQIVNAARRYERIIQCGTQSRSSPSLHDAEKFVREGNLGAIQYAVGTCYKPRKGIGKLSEPLQIPDHVDYDLWCGPAAKVDLYRPQLHYDWHWDWNTGNGDMGNQGIHQMDIARWFLGEPAVSPRVISIGGRLGYEDAGNTPNTQVVFHEYPKAPLIFETRGLPKSKAAQKKWGDSMDNYRGSRIGVIVQCEKGHVVIPSYTRAIAYDNEGKEIKAWSGGGNHFANFLDAVRSRKPSDLNAEVLEGHISSALCHTGGISHQLGKKASASEIAAQVASSDLLADSVERMVSHLKANEVNIDSKSITLGPWLDMDPKTEQFTNNDRAADMVRREDRKPFVVPEVSA